MTLKINSYYFKVRSRRTVVGLPDNTVINNRIMGSIALTVMHQSVYRITAVYSSQYFAGTYKALFRSFK